jgi:hypothetical protein
MSKRIFSLEKINSLSKIFLVNLKISKGAFIHSDQGCHVQALYSRKS